MTTSCILRTIFAALLLSIHQSRAAEALSVEGLEPNEADRLAKELANRISPLINIPFQANEDFGYGPSHNGYRFTLNTQPVIPISISKDWNLILRTILPVVSQHDVFYVENVPKLFHLTQNRSQDGLSDTTQSFFFSPKNPGTSGLIWGVGPVFLYPTGTHPLLDTGTFSIGPTAVAAKQIGGFTVGALMNQLWSVAIGEDRKSLSQLYLQPSLAYTTDTATTFTLSSESTANWNNPPGDAKWTIPLIFSVTFRLGLNITWTPRATAPIGGCALLLLCYIRARNQNRARSREWPANLDGFKAIQPQSR